MAPLLSSLLTFVHSGSSAWNVSPSYCQNSTHPLKTDDIATLSRRHSQIMPVLAMWGIVRHTQCPVIMVKNASDPSSPPLSTRRALCPLKAAAVLTLFGNSHVKMGS